MAGLYIHIPYCKQACHYCDFHFSTSLKNREEMLQCLQKELHLQKDYPGHQALSSIYLGGGTPSLLSEKEITSLFETIHKVFTISPNVEATLEANPDDITPSLLYTWKQLGVNRLSIGLQTFNNDMLTYLNRAHNADQIYASLSLAKENGFDNINLDLMYSLPHAEPMVLENDLNELMRLRPNHISAYCFTLEANTVFGNWHKKGKLKVKEESQESNDFKYVAQTLKAHGYAHYEVSNFALPGHYSQHNTSYWQNEPYLGIGPGAHSFNLHSRQQNISNNAKYITSLQQNRLPITFEKLTKADQVNEYLMTGLRTQWGIDLEKLEEKLGLPMSDYHKRRMDEMINKGLMRRQKNKITLTEEGYLMADHIAMQLFID